MNIADQIKQKIEEAIEPTHLEVINQSHLHKGHAGDDCTPRVRPKFNTKNTRFTAFMFNSRAIHCVKHHWFSQIENK